MEEKKKLDTETKLRLLILIGKVLKDFWDWLNWRFGGGGKGKGGLYG